jgi:hypothetical protein
LRVTKLPTIWGNCSFELRFQERGTSAEIHLPETQRPAQIHLCLAPDKRAPRSVTQSEGVTQIQRQGRNWILHNPAAQVRLSITAPPL